MKLSFFEATHLGARANNQDYYAHLVNDLWSLFIVADGLGGHQKGEVAATEFCDACIACAPSYAVEMDKHPLDAMPQFIAQAAKMMCDNIQQKQGKLNTQTVFALVWLTQKHVITAHVGDARVYRLSENETWRTPDHTFVQQLFDQHKITEADFASHPLQNRLLKALNTFEAPEPDIFLQDPLKSNETLLLCSDGFWARLSKQDLHTLATSTNLSESIQHKIAAILAQFSSVSDNITAQTIRLL